MTVGILTRDRNAIRPPITFETEAAESGLLFSQLPGSGRPTARRAFLLEVHGDLDDELVARMRESLFSAAASAPSRIVIDLAGVSFVDTAGLRTLIAARRRCAAAGASFALRSPSSSIRRLLALTHLEGVFDLETPAVNPSRAGPSFLA